MKINDKEYLLQAFADGQLDAKESARVEKLVSESKECAAFLEEIRALKGLIDLGDTDLPVPVTREFYWSRIQSKLVREEYEVANRPLQEVASWGDTLLKWFIPAAAVGALLVAMVIQNPSPAGKSADFVELTIDHEIETLSKDASYMTFRSEQEGMTVVWLGTEVDY